MRQQAVLFIDTTGSDCRVGLWTQEQCFYAQNSTPQGHAQHILPLIDALLAQHQVSRHDLTGTVYTQGPGAFTGVRIGVSVVQGIAFALSLPTLGVSSLFALAWQAAANHLDQQPKVLAAMDARMGQVYWAVYQFDDHLHPSTLYPPSVGLPTHDMGDIDIAIGDGLGLLSVNKSTLQCYDSLDLSFLVTLVEHGLSQGFLSWSDALPLPVYLRNDVAAKSTKQK